MKYYLIFIVSLILFSCQEEITLDLPQAEMKLVVEGAIEPGFPPYVILTQNQGYFDEIDIDTYSDLFVNNVDTVKVWYYKDSGEKEIKFLSKIEGVDSLPTIFTDLSYDFSGNFPYYFSQEEKTYYLQEVDLLLGQEKPLVLNNEVETKANGKEINISEEMPF